MKKRDVERTQLLRIQKALLDVAAIMAIMETDTTAQVSQCFISYSRQGSYEVLHSPDQAIVEEVQCLDLLQLFHTYIDGLVHLIRFWL